MRVSASYTFDASPRQVWDTLLDPEALAACIPGCQGFEALGDDRYRVTLRVGVAAVSGSYSGTVTVTHKDPPNSYTMQVEGRGAGGSVRGQGHVRLSSQDGGTLVEVSGEAQVTGMVARVGQRLLGSASRMLMNQFFNCMKVRVEGADPAS